MHSSGLRSGPSGEPESPDDPSTGPSADMVARLASLRLDRGGETVVGTNGRYTFSGVFASGGLGVIRRAYDRRLQRDVAIKELRYFQSGSVGEQRFLREALITARLEHPAIVPIHDIGQHGSGEPFFCMKLVDGRSLRELVRAQSGLTERIGLLSHVIAVADAIAYAHDRGIVHRDLKPTNVLIGPFGETVVIDWGLAKDLWAEDAQDGERAFTVTPEDLSGDLTESGEFVGTLPFMPPEQAEGARCDPRADVYAIGAILYFVLSGKIPYEQHSPVTRLAALLSEAPRDLSILEPQIPGDLLAIVRKAMARAAGDRYSSAKELAADLQRFQTGRLVAARTYSAADLLRHFVRRYRAVVRTTAVGAVLLLVFAVYGYSKILEQRRIAEERREQAVTAQRAESAIRVLADARADEAQRVAAQQLLETGRQFLYNDSEPQRALVPLSRAYYQRTSGDDLRRLLDEAAALAGNLEAFLPDVVDFRYSDSGVAVVTWSPDDSVTVWDARSGEAIHRISVDARVKWAVFAPTSEARVLVGTSAGLRLYRGELLEWALPEAIGDDTVVLPGPGDADVVLLVGSDGSAAVEPSTGSYRWIPGMQGSSRTIIDRAVWSRPWVLLPRSVTFGPTLPTVVERYTSAGRRVGGSLEFRRDWEDTLIHSDDGRLLSYTEGDRVHIHDWATGQTRQLGPCGEFERNRGPAPATAPNAVFTPDGAAIMRLTGRRQIARWSTATLACEVFQTTLDREYERLAITRDGETVVLLTKSNVVTTLDPRTLVPRVRFASDTLPLQRFELNPDASQLALLNAAGDLRLWRLADPRVLHSRPVLDVGPGPAVGEAVVLIGDDAGHNPVFRMEVAADADPVTWSPFAEATGLSRISVLDRRSGVFTLRDAADANYELWSYETGRRSTNDLHGSCACESARTDALLSALPPGSRRPERSAAMLDGASPRPAPRGISFGGGRSGGLYDLRDDRYIGPLHGVHGNFSPDGRHVFTSTSIGDLRVYEATSGALVAFLLDGQADKYHTVLDGDSVVTFSPDEQRFAFASNDGTVTVWDAASWAPIATFVGHAGWAQTLAFDPTSRVLLSMGAALLASGPRVPETDGQIFLWDLDTLAGHRLEVGDPTAVAFSADGRTLALGSGDGVIRLWDVDSFGQVGELRGHGRPVTYLEFVGDEKLISAAREDRLNVWRIGKESRSSAALQRFVRSVVPPDILESAG